MQGYFFYTCKMPFKTISQPQKKIQETLRFLNPLKFNNPRYPLYYIIYNLFLSASLLADFSDRRLFDKNLTACTIPFFIFKVYLIVEKKSYGIVSSRSPSSLYDFCTYQTVTYITLFFQNIITAL